MLRSVRTVVSRPDVAARARARVPSRNVGMFSLPAMHNEPVNTFAPGSKERAEVKEALEELKQTVHEIPVVIGGEEFHNDDRFQQTMPSDHQHVLANISQANEVQIEKAIEVACRARNEWARLGAHHRQAVFLKAADLLSTSWRSRMLAATMLGQGKTVHQAEIDATCELIDFYRFGVKFSDDIYRTQPETHQTGTWNRQIYRPLEGFVASISPFNFTAIGGNLAGAPALMGNGVLWKPADTAVLSNWLVFQVLREAGLPDGVINFLPADGPLFGKVALGHPSLAGVNFTGSTNTFRFIWQNIAENIEKYHAYPRICGETGGKNWHIVHESADMETVVYSTIRSAFEYQGQKCSAVSRMYVPRSAWETIKPRLIEEASKAAKRMGQPDDLTNFMSAVIDKNSFTKIKSYIKYARKSPDCTVIAGGNCDDSVGYFVEPTIVETTNPMDKLMVEEIFGPVLSVYVYDDWESMLHLVNTTSGYGLTGAVFARDRAKIDQAIDHLMDSGGNLYINDKSSGAVVGAQPFGGGRGSGTNDKPGSAIYMQRWVSAQAIKEQFLPQHEWAYPHMEGDN